jgi:CubicO group peptidase (beta-lactamase class C family)
MSLFRSALLCVGAVTFFAACSKPAETPVVPKPEPSVEPAVPPEPDPTQALIERGKSFELDTPYSPPPGDINAHYTMGFARTLCSAIFVSGLDEDFAAKNVGYFTSPPETRSVVVERHVDYDKKMVNLTMNNGVVRSAKYVGDLGCVPLPIGESEPYYDPPEIVSMLPDASTTPWPLGDVLPDEPIPAEIDQEKLQAAMDAFYTDGAMTASLVVTYRGRIIAERYADGIDMHTPLESWSMGKSLSATLLGVLIQEGVYTLEQPAPIPEWQQEGDPRQSIRIMDILRMSSGLRCRAPQDPDADPSLGYYDHLYLYTGTVNSFEWAATRPQQWPPNTVGRYRNCDPVLTNYLVRLGVEGRGDDYHQFPQQHLFDKIGVRNLVFQTDPYGNILLQGSDLGPARDWARLGNLYLDDGVANGERILPEGWSEFVSTLAPAWEADGRPIYGAFFWLSGADYGLEPGAVYGMRGAGGQMVDIVPSKKLVIARLGHYAGSGAWARASDEGMKLLMEAVPDIPTGSE